MGKKGLSDKEAALIEAARRELAGQAPAASDAPKTVPVRTAPAASSQTTLPPVGSPAMTQISIAINAERASPAEPPAALDFATRMAMLMDAERQENESRKKRVKKAYVIIVSAIMVPSFLYVFVAMFKLLAR